MASGLKIWREFTLIGSVGDVILPPLMRRPSENTQHQDDDDAYRRAHRQYGMLVFDTFDLDLSSTLLSDSDGLDLESDDDGDALEFDDLSLLRVWEYALLDEWAVQFADGVVWTFLGAVVGIATKAIGIESALGWTIQVLPLTGIDQFQPMLLLESGALILQETEGRFLLSGL